VDEKEKVNWKRKLYFRLGLGLFGILLIVISHILKSPIEQSHYLGSSLLFFITIGQLPFILIGISVISSILYVKKYTPIEWKKKFYKWCWGILIILILSVMFIRHAQLFIGAYAMINAMLIMSAWPIYLIIILTILSGIFLRISMRIKKRLIELPEQSYTISYISTFAIGVSFLILVLMTSYFIFEYGVASIVKMTVGHIGM